MSSITKIFVAALLLSLTCPSQAADDNKGFAAYTWELNAAAGIDLPYDIWGTPGTFSTLALGAAYKVSEKGSIQLSTIYQHASTHDKAYTVDVGYGYELVAADFNTFFVAGLHYSHYALTVDHDSTGACVPENCLTDSGNHSGIFVGGGLQIPLSEFTPLRLSMKFFQNPQLWLLLEAGVGFRF